MDEMSHADRAALQMDRANSVVLPQDDAAHARVWAADNSDEDPFRVGRLAAKLLDRQDGLDSATKAAQAIVKKL